MNTFVDYFRIHSDNVNRCMGEMIAMFREFDITELEIPYLEENETELSISRVYEDYYYTDYISKVKVVGENEFTSIKVVALDGEERWLADYITEDVYMVYDCIYWIFDKMKNHGKAE